MHIPSFIKEGLYNNLGLCISSAQAVFGGDINHNFKILNKDKTKAYFLKFNSSIGHQEIIESEAKALTLFETHNISSPNILFYETGVDLSYLLLEYIYSDKKWNTQSIDSFVNVLTSLHEIKHSHFGLSYNNCIGSLPQLNEWYITFSDYYWQSRLLPQLELAYSTNYLKSPLEYEYIRIRLEEFPSESPCLLHGDLWSGNYLIDSSNEAYLIDPSISFGNREMDLSMMDLFGGFPEAVFEAYDSKLPFDKSWKDRKDMFQLYYLLVHLNLFGVSYLEQVVFILRKYK